MDDKQSLLSRIQMYGFALHEACLFLDTHPDSPEALEYFRRYNQALNDTQAEYTDKYGPLTPYDCKATERWDWVDGPWPWEI